MTSEIAIGKAYDKLLKKCTKTDTPLYQGKTSEDLLGECTITMLKRYSGQTVEECEIFEVFNKIFLEKAFFSFKKKTSKKNKMIEYIPEYGDVI